MPTAPTPSQNVARLQRTYPASAGLVWELSTTAAGLEEWWGPDGFETRVNELDLRPGGQVRYTMTATGPEQVAFVRSLGMALSSEFRRTFTVVAPLDPLHDETWTQGYRAHRGVELDNLETATRRRAR
ncbi:MAG TPA: SRPBCC domain-containing protein [Solirubrobacteraceae bacterium]